MFNKEKFKESMNLVAETLNKLPNEVSIREYTKTCKELKIPSYIGFLNILKYSDIIKEIYKADHRSCPNHETCTPEYYDNKIRDALLTVSKKFNKNVNELSRDFVVDHGHTTLVNWMRRCTYPGNYKAERAFLFPDSKKYTTTPIKAELPNKANSTEEVVRLAEEARNKRIISIEESFLKYIQKYHQVPKFKELKDFSGVDASADFQSPQELEEHMVSKYENLKDFLFNETSVTEDYRDNIDNEIKKHSRFIITTAVSEKKVNANFFNSIKNYAKVNNAMVLVLPCEDVSNRKRVHKWNMDPALREFNLIFEDVYLNKHIYLSTIKTSAKQIVPITGLDRLTSQKNATIIFGSTKQFLKYIPTNPKKVPNALMTTGAITEPNYDTDYYMSKRLSVIAENDHTLGAIIVEIEDNNIFHFRQVQASKTGSFCDLGVEYYPNGTKKEVSDTIMVFGDAHIGKDDNKLTDKMLEIAKELNVSEVILHDIFHADSVSHHDYGKVALSSIKANEGRSSLVREGKKVSSYLTEVSKVVPKIVIVKSNHDEHLERYLEEGRPFKDPENFYTSLDLYKTLIEGKDPLRYLIETKLGLKIKNIKWLKSDESYKKYGVELGMHGHRGANGSRGSAQIFEKAVGKAITAHTHTASIMRTIFTVGIGGAKDQGYNKGLSSWTRTSALLYPNGNVQLINFLDYKGDYRWKID